VRVGPGDTQWWWDRAEKEGKRGGDPAPWKSQGSKETVMRTKKGKKIRKKKSGLDQEARRGESRD